MTGGRAAWRWCVAAGCLAFFCSWLFGRIPGLVACGPSHGLGPIMAFEMGRTPGEIAALFGTDPCRATLVGAQKTGLLLDAFGFIPGYTAFLIFATRAAAMERKWGRIVIAALLLAGLCDEIEGGLLYAIMRDLPGTPALVTALGWEVRIKFALLIFGTLAIGRAMLRPRLVATVVAAPILVGGTEAAFGFVNLPTPKMMGGFTLAWIALLVSAFIGSLWPSLFSAARAAPPPRPVAPSP